MADVVQYRLERMVGELDDLERREIFTRAEIAEIVKQRRKFEYRLKRPSPLKEDFIAYIDYEVKLDELRQLRRKSVARVTKKRKKKSVSDFAGVARIVEIYRLATMRYKGDINLWFRYLEFCKQKRHGRMKKVKDLKFAGCFVNDLSLVGICRCLIAFILSETCVGIGSSNKVSSKSGWSVDICCILGI